jgi:AcrR family transcriptional regulator
VARLPIRIRNQVLAQTRQRLLDAAVLEFARVGYVGASINRISKAAGFAQGTIYNYFPSKCALMVAVTDHIAAAHTETILKR